MRCPFCGHADTQVVETRDSDEGDAIRRRRRCAGCERRFTTYERADVAWPVVVKKDGTRVEFDPEKLRASMMLALRKRKVEAPRIDTALAGIHAELRTRGEREVSTTALGQLVMAALKDLDAVAYIRFASVYQELKDVAGFKRLIRDL